MVDEEDLEARLAHVRAQAAGEREGVFGPRSMTWRVDREAALFLGAGRALILQLAHPWVATAIRQHSTTLADPIGRFHRTFDVMFTLVFGTLEQALAASRRLHGRHSAIAGTMPGPARPFAAGSPYLANEAAALMWVHATLAETALVAHDLVLPPLSCEERELYYAESRVMAALFGIPEAMVPANWAAFEAYNRSMWESETLTVTPAARAIADALLLEGARFWLRPPRWYRALTASILPERLREGFGLRYGEHQERVAARSLRLIRRLYPRLPERLRFAGPYQEARERLIGHGPGTMTRMANRMWIGRGTLRGETPRV
jgi:uncharacterized protein (DUF2236 family)